MQGKTDKDHPSEGGLRPASRSGGYALRGSVSSLLEASVRHTIGCPPTGLRHFAAKWGARWVCYWLTARPSTMTGLVEERTPILNVPVCADAKLATVINCFFRVVVAARLTFFTSFPFQ